MGIKTEVDTIEEVDEKYRDLYTAQGDKFVLTGVEGIKPLHEFAKVHSSLGKERTDHKATKAKLDAWAAFGTAEEVQAKLDRIAELEAAAGGKLNDEQINKLVDGRIGAKTAPLQRELDTTKASLAERDQIIAGYKAKDVQRSIVDSLRDALKKHEGFQATAIDDAAMLAERMFEVDEDGNVVTKDGVGVTPGIDMVVWLTEMQTKRPHWWGTSQGGGATGSKGNLGGGGANPWTAENWNATEQTRIYKENAQRAEQLAKSAGTTVGGLQPQRRS